jgi:hypothetical protein
MIEASLASEVYGTSGRKSLHTFANMFALRAFSNGVTFIGRKSDWQSETAMKKRGKVQDRLPALF